MLNSEDDNLRGLLYKFQLCGSLSAFGEENCSLLTESLKPYLDKLTMWVLGGFGGEGSKYQLAEYILTYNNNTSISSFHSIDEYIELLHEKRIEGNFGTLFGWTYPSGRRGKDIQLKCKII